MSVLSLLQKPWKARCHHLVPIKRLLGLPQLLAPNCISIDFKAAVHQRGGCNFSRFCLFPLETSKTCEGKVSCFAHLDHSSRDLAVRVTASEDAASLLFHYFYAGMSHSSSALVARHHGNTTSLFHSLKWFLCTILRSLFLLFIFHQLLAFKGLNLVEKCERAALKPFPNAFLKYDCRRPSDWMLVLYV